MHNLSTQQAGKSAHFRVTRRIAKVGLVAGLIAGLAACAVFDRRTPQEVVKEKAQARWDALVKGDVAAAYVYLSPGSKAMTPLDAYKNSIKPGFWKSVVVDKVDCTTVESCDVVATIEYEIQSRRIKTPMKETWIRDGSNWWFVQK